MSQIFKFNKNPAMLCSRTALKCCFVLNGYILTKLTEHRSDQTRTEPGPQTGEECETSVDYFPFFKLEQPTFLGLWSSRRPHSSSSLSLSSSFLFSTPLLPHLHCCSPAALGFLSLTPAQKRLLLLLCSAVSLSITTCMGRSTSLCQ